MQSADLSDQCKRKTILSVPLPFPSIKNRLRVDMPEEEVRHNVIIAFGVFRYLTCSY